MSAKLRQRLASGAAACVLFLIGALAGRMYAQVQLTPVAFMPLILHVNAQSAYSIEVVQDIAMPFDVYGAVEPTAVQDASGVWFISVYRLGGANTGQWLVAWQPGSTTVTPIGLTAPATELSVGLQDVPITNSRGSVSYSHNLRDGYIFSWQDKEGGSRRPLLRVARIIGFAP